MRGEKRKISVPSISPFLPVFPSDGGTVDDFIVGTVQIRSQIPVCEIQDSNVNDISLDSRKQKKKVYRIPFNEFTCVAFQLDQCDTQFKSLNIISYRFY